jgi:hypothetical protein
VGPDDRAGVERPIHLGIGQPHGALPQPPLGAGVVLGLHCAEHAHHVGGAGEGGGDQVLPNEPLASCLPGGGTRAHGQAFIW